MTVPATTANLGPGFDCLGAALSLHNTFTFSVLDSSSGYLPGTVHITVSGVGAEGVDTQSNNLAYQAFCAFYEDLGQTPPAIHLAIALNIPLARGLGSSATAIVGGLMGANELAGMPMTQEAILKRAIALEGHPDNVVPALLGGCQLSVAAEENWMICEIPWQSSIVPVVAIPDFELSTQSARAVLPQQYSREDAIYNAAHLGLVLRGLETGRADWLRVALGDRIHQPYRKALIPDYDAVRDGALAAGACGVVISGAGPTLLALTELEHVDAVVDALTTAWATQRVRVLPLSLESKGAQVTK